MLMRFDPVRELAFRDADRLIIRFDMAGMDRDSIDLTADKNVLTVR